MFSDGFAPVVRAGRGEAAFDHTAQMRGDVCSILINREDRRLRAKELCCQQQDDDQERSAALASSHRASICSNVS